jgi:hypothetical protein
VVDHELHHLRRQRCSTWLGGGGPYSISGGGEGSSASCQAQVEEGRHGRRPAIASTDGVSGVGCRTAGVLLLHWCWCWCWWWFLVHKICFPGFRSLAGLFTDWRKEGASHSAATRSALVVVEPGE